MGGRESKRGRVGGRERRQLEGGMRESIGERERVGVFGKGNQMGGRGESVKWGERVKE